MWVYKLSVCFVHMCVCGHNHDGNTTTILFCIHIRSFMFLYFNYGYCWTWYALKKNPLFLRRLQMKNDLKRNAALLRSQSVWAPWTERGRSLPGSCLRHIAGLPVGRSAFPAAAAHFETKLLRAADTRERTNMPAVSKGDGMRGLAVFISDIRNCKFCLSPSRTALASASRAASGRYGGGLATRPAVYRNTSGGESGVPSPRSPQWWV